MAERSELFSEKKYYGIYRALVVDNDDPRKLGRLVLQIPEVFGTDLVSDWAFPKNGWLGAINKRKDVPERPEDQPVLNPERNGDKGDFLVPDIGDGVWVEFEAGDPCRPVWSGRWWSEPAGGSEVPMLAREIPDESQVPPKGTDQMVTADGRVLHEPPISFDPTYPRNRVLKTKSGIVIEYDDTPGKERIHIWHPKRTWLEVHPDGTVTEHVQVRRYLYIEVDRDEHIKGQWNVHVHGDATLHVQGDYIRHIEGNEIIMIDKNKIETVGASFTQQVGNEISRTAGSHIVDYAPRIDHN